jgi:hypothetical protein
MEVTWPKLLILNVLLLLALAAVVSSNGEATEDLGETDPFVSACHFTSSLVEAQGYVAGSCRRIEDEVVYRHNGRSVIVPVMIRVNGEWITLDVFMEKSLWYGSALRAR